MLTKIKKIEGTKELNNLMAWAKAKGAKFNKITIKYYSPDFRGVHATSSIMSGERIMTIPDEIILTSTVGIKESPLGAKIYDSEVDIDYPYCTYISCLLFEAEKNPKHKWR